MAREENCWQEGITAPISGSATLDDLTAPRHMTKCGQQEQLRYDGCYDELTAILGFQLFAERS